MTLGKAGRAGCYGSSETRMQDCGALQRLRVRELGDQNMS